jgi:hypothetical protein
MYARFCSAAAREQQRALVRRRALSDWFLIVGCSTSMATCALMRTRGPRALYKVPLGESCSETRQEAILRAGTMGSIGSW